MKEKHTPARSLSLWAYPGILIVVLVSCTLTGILTSANPYTAKIFFNDWGVYWDDTEENLNFFSFSPDVFYWSGLYSLDDNGHIMRIWKSGEKPSPELWTWDNSIHSLTSERLAIYEDRYGKIQSYNVINQNVIALIVSYDPPLQQFYSQRLIIIKNGNVDTAQIIDATTLFQVDMEADRRYLDLIAHSLLWIGCMGLSVLGIRRLPYKNIALLAYVILLGVGIWAGLGLQGFD